MKFKFKKIHLFFLVLILFIALLAWMFMRSAFADMCSIDLNTCLLKGKSQSFFPRLWAGFVCTIKNLGCLFSQMF